VGAEIGKANRTLKPTLPSLSTTELFLFSRCQRIHSFASAGFPSNVPVVFVSLGRGSGLAGLDFVLTLAMPRDSSGMKRFGYHRGFVNLGSARMAPLTVESLRGKQLQ
jgi:hypothetical protein